jgi:hypothetical protein
MNGERIHKGTGMDFLQLYNAASFDSTEDLCSFLSKLQTLGLASASTPPLPVAEVEVVVARVDPPQHHAPTSTTSTTQQYVPPIVPT